MAIAARFKHVSCGLTADGSLEGCVDVARRQPVTCGLLAIDLDLHGRLPERGEDGKISHAFDRRHYRLDLAGYPGQLLEVVAVELD